MKHWDSDEELADRELVRAIAAEELARLNRSWPQGATAGLVLVAACCLATGLTLFKFAGPRDVVEDSIRGR